MDLASSDPCGHLAEIVAATCAQRTQDALCIFLKTHICICLRIVSANSPALKTLNDSLIRRFLTAYDAFKQHEPEKLPRLWLDAFAAYKRLPDSPKQVLIRFVAAHIIEDLSNALCCLMQAGLQLPKHTYDNVLDNIAACAQSEGALALAGDTLADRILDQLQRYIDPLGEFAIRQLRDYAWDQAFRLLQQGDCQST